MNRARPLAVSLPDCTESPAPAATVSTPISIPRYAPIMSPSSDIFDVSMVTAVLTPALLYRALLCLFPEPRGMLGPRGSRGAPMADQAIAPVTSEARVSASVWAAVGQIHEYFV